jgi:uncharacterized lipoprotein YmbA
MPCTACGSSVNATKSYQLNKTKQNTSNTTNTRRVVYLTPQQIAAIRQRQQNCRRTLIFT